MQWYNFKSLILLLYPRAIPYNDRSSRVRKFNHYERIGIDRSHALPSLTPKWTTPVPVREIKLTNKTKRPTKTKLARMSESGTLGELITYSDGVCKGVSAHTTLITITRFASYGPSIEWRPKGAMPACGHQRRPGSRAIWENVRTELIVRRSMGHYATGGCFWSRLMKKKNQSTIFGTDLDASCELEFVDKRKVVQINADVSDSFN